MRLLQIIVCGLALVTLGAAAWTQGPVTFYAVTGAKLIAVPGQVIENATVIIRDGLIEQAGAGVAVPRGARAIEARGLVVYPGFIDGAATFGLKAPEPVVDQDDPINRQEDVQASMRAALRKGLRPELAAAQWIVVDDSWRRHRQAGFATALIAPTGGHLNGTSALLNLTGESRRSALVNSRVFMHADLRPSAGGFGGGGGYPGTLMGVLAHTRQFLLDAQWNNEAWRVYEIKSAGRRPFHDDALEAIVPAMEGRITVAFHADSESDIRRALKFAREFHLRPIIVGGAEAWKLAGELAREQVEVIVSLNFGPEPRVSGGPATATPPTNDDELTAGAPPPGGGRPGGASGTGGATAAPVNLGFELPETPLRWRQEQKRLYDQRLANAGKLRAAGVRIALTSLGLTNPGDFVPNLQKAIQSGLSANDAVAALTSEASRVLQAPQLGAVKPGMIANLTVLTGAVESAGAKARYLFIDGKFFEPEKETAPSPAAATPPGLGDDGRQEARS